MLSYIIAGERKLTLPQALKIESLFSLKTGTLILMQDEDYIKKYQITLRHSLCMKLIEVNAFWSYDNAAEDDISDEDIIEKIWTTFPGSLNYIHGNMSGRSGKIGWHLKANISILSI